MKKKIWNKLKKAKTKVAIAVLFSLLVASLAFVNAAPGMLFASQMNIFALETTSVDISNTTSTMTTLFITLITVMIPLIIIMAYLGIFQDFIGAIGRAFSGIFKRQ